MYSEKGKRVSEVITLYRATGGEANDNDVNGGVVWAPPDAFDHTYGIFDPRRWAVDYDTKTGIAVTYCTDK